MLVPVTDTVIELLDELVTVLSRLVDTLVEGETVVSMVRVREA